ERVVEGVLDRRRLRVGDGGDDDRVHAGEATRGPRELRGHALVRACEDRRRLLTEERLLEEVELARDDGDRGDRRAALGERRGRDRAGRRARRAAVRQGLLRVGGALE